MLRNAVPIAAEQLNRDDQIMTDTFPKIQAVLFDADGVVQTIFRNWENVAWMHNEGLFPESEWVGLVEDIEQRSSSMPFIAEQWRLYRLRYTVNLHEILDPVVGIKRR